MVAFLVGIGRTEIFYVCAAVASLIHYFTLVSVMWMGAMALLMFQKLIFAFEKASFKYVLLVSLVSWCKSSNQSLTIYYLHHRVTLYDIAQHHMIPCDIT